jgi:hypothetical protein
MSVEDKTAWLDRFCGTRYLNQRDLARRWSTRADPEPMLERLPPPAPDRPARIVCPVMTMVAEFFVAKRYGTWKPKQL